MDKFPCIPTIPQPSPPLSPSLPSNKRYPTQPPTLPDVPTIVPHPPLRLRYTQQDQTSPKAQTRVRDMIEEDDMSRQVNVRTKRRPSRAGALNYSTSDIDALLDCVSLVKPLGSNHWAEVTAKFRVWAVESGRPSRDQDSIKNKFDKLANAKKKTGDPSCPDNVRRAKYIARDIQQKFAAIVLGSDEENVEGEEFGVEENEEIVSSLPEETENAVGVQARKRHPGALGVKRDAKRGKHDEDKLVQHVAKMSGHLGTICESLLSRGGGVGKEEIKKVVKEEMDKSLKPTNDMLLKIAKSLDVLMGKKT